VGVGVKLPPRVLFYV